MLGLRSLAMTRAQWVISCCLAWHLLAVAAVILPTVTADSAPQPSQRRADRVAAAVAPVLDHAAAGVWQVARATTVVTAPVRRATRDYARGLGFVRHWRMFVPPSLNDEYVRLRYYVGSTAAHSSGGAPTWVASEIVLPAHPFGKVRGIAAFRDRRRDKAVDEMADRYRQRMRTRQHAKQGLSDELRPAVRYFSRQFAKGRLQAGERIVRVEVWLGRAPSPPPGMSDNPDLKARREQVLDGYYRRGGVESQLGTVRYSPYGAAEQEADITWTLMFFQAI